jgi:hypothetical protein
MAVNVGGGKYRSFDEWIHTIFTDTIISMMAKFGAKVQRIFAG